VDAGSVSAYERYMRERHIPDLLTTGHFVSASFATAGPGRYRIRYEVPTREALDAYLRDHATRLRADFASHFPSGVELSREIWITLEAWPGP
jgi:hypothetical protein